MKSFTNDKPPSQGRPRFAVSTSSSEQSRAQVRRVLTRQDKEPVSDEKELRIAAQQGISQPGGPLPHLEQIQKSFGHHDLNGVVAHTDANAGAAARRLGTQAYTMGNHVAFAERPTLEVAAHEAAHVVQQRNPLQLAGRAGQVADPYEAEADAVAALVAKGESAEKFLNIGRYSESKSPHGHGENSTENIQMYRQSFSPRKSMYFNILIDSVATFYARKSNTLTTEAMWGDSRSGRLYIPVNEHGTLSWIVTASIESLDYSTNMIFPTTRKAVWFYLFQWDLIVKPGRHFQYGPLKQRVDQMERVGAIPDFKVMILDESEKGEPARSLSVNYQSTEAITSEETSGISAQAGVEILGVGAGAEVSHSHTQGSQNAVAIDAKESLVLEVFTVEMGPAKITTEPSEPPKVP